MQIKHFIRLYSVSNSDIRAPKIHVFLTIGGQYSNSLLDQESIERYRTLLTEDAFYVAPSLTYGSMNILHVGSGQKFD